MIKRSSLRPASLGLAVTCVLGLTACNGSGSGAEHSLSSPVSAPPEGASSALATEGPATASASPSTPPLATSLEPTEAKAALGRVYSNLLTSRSAQTPAAATARGNAFSGQQLKVAVRESIVQKGDPEYQKPDAGAAKVAPLLLAISTADSPHKLVLGEAQPNKDNLPELYVAETAAVPQNLRITHVARMLPERRLQKLQPPIDGTPELPETTKVRGVTPRQLFDKYMAYMTYPEPQAEIEDQPFVNDPYIANLERVSRDRANALGDNGTYTMKNTLVPNSIRTFKRADGALIVFGHFERLETVKVKNGVTIQAPASVKAVNPKLSTVRTEMTIRTDVCLAFYLYPYKKAELLAGSEQLLAASGG